MEGAAQQTEAPKEIGWAVLEIMGHRRVSGFVREEAIAGVKMLRVEIPGFGDRCRKCFGDRKIKVTRYEPEYRVEPIPCPACSGTGKSETPEAEIFATQFYSGGSLFSMTPCEEMVARRAAWADRPAEVTRLALPGPSGIDADDEESEEHEEPEVGVF